jgi:hypothetical protein
MNWKKSQWWQRTLLRAILFRLLFRYNDGTYVLNERWDNLIILDACRFDVFEEVMREREMTGILEKRVSRGTNTGSFLKENFSNGRHEDIVYVSGNPYVSYFVRGKFFKIIPVWKYGWDQNYRTVRPETMYSFTLDAIKQYSGKRFVIHFMQPHEPYLSHVQYAKVALRGTSLLERRIPPRALNVYANGWFRYFPSLDRRTILQHYKQNLEIVMPYVEKLMKVLPGRTVVTADHGEALGEVVNKIVRVRLFGHCPGARIPALTNVPWLYEEREKAHKSTVRQEDADTEFLSEEEEKLIQERLKALGYD